MSQPGFFDDTPKTVYERYREECAATAKLFVPVAHNSPTSAEAAASLSSCVVAAQEGQVLDAIAGSDQGMTSDAIEARLGLRHQSASARIWGLRKKGLIHDSGRVAPTRSGRSAVLWVRTTQS